MSKKTNKLFIAYFDSLGFECIIDLTGQEKKQMWAVLSEKPAPRLPVHQMILRAQANPQRRPEIWTFWSELDTATLLEYSKEYAQELAELIRSQGSKVFTTIKEKELIK